MKTARTEVLRHVENKFGVDAHDELATIMPTFTGTMVGYSMWGRRGFEVADRSRKEVLRNLEKNSSPTPVQKTHEKWVILNSLRLPKATVSTIKENLSLPPTEELSVEDQLDSAFEEEEEGPITQEEKQGFAFSELSLAEKQSVLDFAVETVDRLFKKASDSATALLESPNDGEFDLFEAMHGGELPTNRINQKHWVNTGNETDYVFDLSHGSKSLKAFYKGAAGKALLKERTNEKIAEAITEYRSEIKDADPESIQLTKDKYNDLVMDKEGEIGLDFPLFASSRNPNPVSSGDKYDFSMIPELLEISQLEYKTYKSPKGVLARMFQGDLGSPIKSMLDQRDEFKRGGLHVLKSFHRKFNDVIKEDGIILDDSTLLTIATAQGYNKDSLVNNSFYVTKESEHRARVEKIEADDTLTRAQKKVQKVASEQTSAAEIDSKEQSAIAARNLETAQALSDLAAMSPRLASLITSMRSELIQPLQEKIKGAGISDELRVRIDQTGGFYITRSYRMFNDPTFAQKVREDPLYGAVRAEGMAFFDKDIKDKARAAALNQNKSAVEADDAADKALRDAHDKAGAGSTHGERKLLRLSSKGMKVSTQALP
jgi:hypothetical protein